MATFQSESTERGQALIQVPADPTGFGVPSWGYTAVDSTDEPATYVAGTWNGTYNTATGTIWAQTPIMPATGSELVIAEGEWMLWVKYNFGDVDPVLKAGTIEVV